MPNLTKQSLSETEKLELKKFLRALEAFLEIRSTMPLQYVTAFLLVALDEGEGVGDYGRKAGVSQSVISRHLLDIGERNRHMEAGFGLVTQKPDPMELRRHQVTLSPKGTALAKRIVRVLTN